MDGGFYAKQKVCNIHYIDFKSTREIYFPTLSRKTKISDCIFSFNTHHGGGSLKGANVSLVLLTKIQAH